MEQTSSVAAAVVDEATLRRASREVTELVPLNGLLEEEETVKKVRLVLGNALVTAQAVRVSATHRAAACNLLCAIVERCQASSVEGISGLIWQNDLWMRLFDVYLDRSDNAKAKPMRQVLVVLTNLVLQCSNKTMKQATYQGALSKLFDILFREQDHLRVKPASQALAHFLMKKLVMVDGMLDLFHKWHLTQSTSAINGYDRQHYTEPFLDGLSNWILHNDAAPAAGHLICVVLTKAREQQAELLSRMDSMTGLPSWVKPLEKSVRKAPYMIQNFKNYVFPDVFRLSLTEYLCCLEHWHLEEQIRLKVMDPVRDGDGNASSEADVETVLLFAALQTGKETGLIKEVDHRLNKTITMDKEAICIPDVSLGRLLAHASSLVRLSALSLLTSSASITRPCTFGTLKCLERHLPHLLADTDASFRSEVLGLLQQLVDRLRAATASLTKTLSKEQKIPGYTDKRNGSTNRGSSVVLSESCSSLSAHKSFVSWLIDFLTTELRPSASYQRHVSALRALTMLLKSGLDPMVSHVHYSRQAQGQIKWPFHFQILKPGLVRATLDLVMDPFDDIRHAAALVLRMGNQETALEGADTIQQSSPVERSLGSEAASGASASLVKFIKRAEKTMLRTGRADHADGVARAYGLLFEQARWTLPQGRSTLPEPVPWWSTSLTIVEHLVTQLEDTVALARQNFSAAVAELPMHGALASLRYIFDSPGFYSSIGALPAGAVQEWRQLHQRIFGLLDNIWQCVREVLCNDAPEGHVPEDLEEDVELDTKDILSYAWRALKEASTLLRVAISKAPFHQEGSVDLLELSDFKDLGQLCFIQLAELRHRGAFSTVAQTFAACCLRCTHTNHEAIQALPLTWHQETLRCIRNKASTVTRRSAGIPSLITGILSADPEGSLVERAMQDLEAEARSETLFRDAESSRLPQVHALNCLRSIFIHTRLGQVSERHIGMGLDLAASRLESNTWAIRNCGLMLFRALLDRLFGSSDSQNWSEDEQATARFSYENHPNLLNIIVKLLEPRRSLLDANRELSTSQLSEPSSLVVEGVFPALQILQRAPPPAERRPAIRGLVLRLTESSHWHVRDMAARTFSRIIDNSQFVGTISTLTEMTSYQGQNALHGRLLCTLYTVRAQLQNGLTADLRDAWSIVVSQCSRCLERNPCPFTKAAFVDIINVFGKSLVMCHDSARISFHKVHAALYAEFREQIGGTLQPASSTLRRSLALYLAFSCILYRTCDEDSSEHTVPAPESLRWLLMQLAESDPDTCCATLETLNEMSTQMSRSRRTYKFSNREDLIEALYELMSNDDTRTKVAAQFFLYNILEESNTAAIVSSPATSTSIMDSLRPGDTPLYGSPSATESALCVQGRILSHRIRAQSFSHELNEEIERHLVLVQRCLHESNPFPTRHAAILSLSSLNSLWKTEVKPGEPAPPLLLACLVTYDALNDDDDEIRDLAATVITRIVARKHYRDEMKDVVPLVASQKLSQHLAKTYNRTQELCIEGIRRMTNCGSSRTPLRNSVAEILAQAREEDTALFVQEKQNLFIDEVREAIIWSRVLSTLSVRAVPREFAHAFSRWVMDGIVVLTECATSHVDGPLGWTSKTEVFTLGMQVIYGAEVLLNWRTRSRKVPVAGSAIRRALREFADAAYLNKLHPLWLEKLERILSASVMGRLTMLKRSMNLAVEQLK